MEAERWTMKPPGLSEGLGPHAGSGMAGSGPYVTSIPSLERELGVGRKMSGKKMRLIPHLSKV